MAENIQVTVSGPFFTADKSTVTRIYLSEGVRDLTQEAERRTRAQLYPGHGVLTGSYQSSIHGRMQSELKGVVNDQGNWWQGPWLEGVSKRNQATRFKGYHMFRRAKAQIRRLTNKAGDDIAKKIVVRLSK